MPVDVQTWRARIGTYNAGRLSAIRARYHLPKSIESIKGLDVSSGCGTVLFGLVVVLSLLHDLLRGSVGLSDVISAIRVRCGRTKLVSSTKMANVLCGTAVLLFVLAMALCLLLLQSGDVERNPGPKGEVERLLPTVDLTPLTEDDLFDVYKEMMPLASKWRNIALAMGIKKSDIDIIHSQYPGLPCDCLQAALDEWLKKGYNVEKHGPPTWKKVVEAVAHPAGGKDPASAGKIAHNHQGKTATPHLQGVYPSTECAYCPDFHPPASESPEQVPSLPPRPDPKETHPLSSKFAMIFTKITDVFNASPVDVIELKKYLGFYSHPLYPEKPLVEAGIFKEAKTAGDVLGSLWPQYINYMNYYLLENIVEEFQCDEASKLLEDYKGVFDRKRKLSDLPSPLTDQEIEQSRGVKKLKVGAKGDYTETTVKDVEDVQKALEKATGIKGTFLVYASHDPGRSIILSFLIPESISHILHELGVDDLTILADSGVLRLELIDELVIENIQPFATVKARAEPVAEGSKRFTLEYYLKEREADMNPEQYSYILRMLKGVSMFELHKVITDDFLAGFARNLSNWKNLAPYFSLTDVDVDQITEYCPDEDDRKYQALLHWKKHERYSATYHTLLETLLLHGEMEEVEVLLGRLGPDHTALYTSQRLKQKYLAHDPWQRWKDIPNLMQFDQRLAQLQLGALKEESASDQLEELDYFMCYETLDQFPSEITPFSVKSLLNDIALRLIANPVFLIEGPPGMGKSHLMAKLCRYWALGFGMREYTLVFWVNMAAFQHPPKTLKDLLRGVLPRSQNTEHLCKWIMDRDGEGTMFILDGWNHILHMTLPKHSKIIVTSYTLSALPKEWLRYPDPPQITRRRDRWNPSIRLLEAKKYRERKPYNQVHLLGLTPSQISKQVTRYHSIDPLKAEAVLLHLASNTDIKQLASYPVYLYAILLISDHVSPSDLPDTWTEMFTLLTLLHFQQPLILPEQMSTFSENLPSEIFSHFCKSAFDRLVSRYYHSTEKCVHKGIAIFTDQGGFLNFTFPLLKHFLAAVRIHQLSVSKQKQLMKQHQKLNFIWLFYAGLSTCNTKLYMYHQNDAKTLANRVYEAGYTMTLPCSYIKNTILTASDIHHILTQCGGELKSLTFHKCCLGTEALTQLSKLSVYLDPMERTQLSFESCMLSEEGLAFLGGNTVGQLRRVGLPSAFGSIGKKKVTEGAYISLYEFNGTHSAELSIRKGEILRVYNAAEGDDWVQACREDGREGLVPANHIRRASLQKVQAACDYADKTHPEALQFKEGELLHLFTDLLPGDNVWLLGTTADGKTGLVPSNYVYKSY